MGFFRFWKWTDSPQPPGDETGQAAPAEDESRDWRHSLVQRRISRVDYLRPQRWNWYSLMRPLDRSLNPNGRLPLSLDGLRALRFLWLDGLFSSASESFYLGFISLFLVALGANNSQVGWSVAVANLLGAIALFPGARLTERLGQRKATVVWTGGGVARLALLGLAVIPLLAGRPELVIPAVIILNGVRGFMSNFCNPAWTSLIGDIVPDSVRGRYFGSRNIAMSVAALVITPLAGWLIVAGNGLAGLKLGGYQAIFLLAFVMGLVSTASFARIPEPAQAERPARPPRPARSGLRQSLQVPPAFWGFVLSAFIWNLAIQASAPFFNVFMQADMHLSTTTIGLLSAVSSLTGLLGYQLFGKWLDRKGAYWVQVVTGLTIPLVPAAWILVTSPWHIVAINAFSGIVWAGYGLSNLSLLLDLTPGEQRPRAVALYQTVVFGSAFIGPLIGGYLADAAGFQLVFGLSAAGRMVGMILFLWLVGRSASLRAGRHAATGPMKPARA